MKKMRKLLAAVLLRTVFASPAITFGHHQHHPHYFQQPDV
jgi:hypothetical protein